MCGITGIFDTRGSRTVNPTLLRRMNDSQRHRGPDDGDVYLEPGLGLGHRRLSIIDIAGGHQPLFNEDRSVVVVFNGEIYNYQSLIPKLQALGHVFATRSDTEVIVHAWESWGERCVEHFRGMFAFALWDRNRQSLFLARDRLGVKPLYWTVLEDGHLLFGSELKSLLANPAVRRSVDPTAIEDYLALGYVPEPRTVFAGISKLEPGHHLLIRRAQPIPPSRQYWDLRFTLDNQIGLADAQVELRERLQESVRLRMIAEVPLGAFLSGGVDSSAIVATMASVSTTPVRTCAIAFDDPRYDESRFAELVAKQYGTEHITHTVSSNDFGLIDTLARLYDEPYADSSAIPTYRVCQVARRSVTVALSGDGGDEAFGGYRRYRMHVMEHRIRSMLPGGLGRAVFGAMGSLYPKLDWAPRFLRAKTTFQGIARDPVGAYCNSVSQNSQSTRERLYSPAMKRMLAGYRAEEVFRRHASAAATDDPLALVQYLDAKTYLVGDINTKVDRASMAHSLEVREPLMDHPLVEWLASLPTALKLHGNQGKYLLKKAMEPALPHDVLYRPKMGFSVPLASWFRGPLRERVRESVLGERLQDTGWFDGAALKKMVDAHQNGTWDHSTPLWSLLMLEAFLRCVVDQEDSAGHGSARTGKVEAT